MKWTSKKGCFSTIFDDYAKFETAFFDLFNASETVNKQSIDAISIFKTAIA